MTSQKYAYDDDLALLYASRDWKAVGVTLSQNMITLFSLSPDLEAKAQQYKNGDGDLSF